MNIKQQCFHGCTAAFVFAMACVHIGDYASGFADGLQADGIWRGAVYLCFIGLMCLLFNFMKWLLKG